MTLRVSGKNINIGEALRTHVTDRLNALTGKYFDGAVTGHVTISPEGTGFRADCSLHLTSGMLLQADGRAQDPYAAFDQSAERIEKRLRRYKSRLKSQSTTQLRRRSVSQAVLDLDLSGAPICVFRHASTGRVNVVYRRADQNIGWIDTPEGA